MASSKEEALKADYADLGVTVGYIGNIETWGDDRAWRIFTNLRDAHGWDVSISIPGPDFDDAEVRRRLDTIRTNLSHYIRR